MSKWTIKRTAQVGKDIIENVEYFTYDKYDNDFNNLFAFEKEEAFKAETLKNRIEHIWHTICRPFWRAKFWFENTYWVIRYGFQRMFKGYDSVDIFETFSSFTKRYYKIFTEMKNNHYSHPVEMSNEEWNNIIDEILYHLYYMDEDNVDRELMKDVSEDWTPCSITVYEIMNKHKDEFFKLFSKYFYDLYFYDLWD